MKAEGSPLFAAFVASAAAGPLFAAFGACAALYGELPRPITVTAEDFSMFLLLLVPATIVGFVLAFLPNLLGVALMAALADAYESARDPIAWAGAGALAGAGIAATFTDIVSPVGFALILTAAVSARICRAQFAWMPA